MKIAAMTKRMANDASRGEVAKGKIGGDKAAAPDQGDSY